MRNILALFLLLPALAFASYSYTDESGVRLRLLDAPCAAEGAVEIFVSHGVPPQIAVTAQGAEIADGKTVYKACYLVHPAGIVFSVSPELGDGIFQMPVDAFAKDLEV